MDYDNTEIATSYDKARVVAPETVRLWQHWLSVDVAQTEMSLVIDLGCGTGRFSEILATHFGCQVIGIDPSRKMVEQARRKPANGNISYREGPAEAIPISDGCAGLVFMSNVYHHLNKPPLVARECHRVLRLGGYVCIRNGTRETDFLHRHFFPGLDTLIDTELPSRRDIDSVFVAAGFAPVVHRVVTQVIAPDWGSFVAKSALRADSFLARLSDHDFEEGMAALRSPGEEIDQDDPVTEEIDWFVLARADHETPAA
jgi:ubiquinone/menaquinone biosynthesis C-methylase UbiE